MARYEHRYADQLNRLPATLKNTPPPVSTYLVVEPRGANPAQLTDQLEKFRTTDNAPRITTNFGIRA